MDNSALTRQATRAQDRALVCHAVAQSIRARDEMQYAPRSDPQGSDHTAIGRSRADNISALAICRPSERDQQGIWFVLFVRR